VPCNIYTLIVLCLFVLLRFVHLTNAGLTDDDEHMPPQSPRMKGIIQAFVHEVMKQTEVEDNLI
jgi:hypothetical protein